MTTGIK